MPPHLYDYWKAHISHRIQFFVVAFSGLDLTDNKDVKFEDLMSSDMDVARKAYKVRQALPLLQESFNAIEKVSAIKII